MAERISAADVVQAALDVLAVGGLPALAMRRIATELGVQQSALYWHFENKQALLAAVADEILTGLDAPEGRDWSDRVLDLAISLRRCLLRHPDGAELVATAFAFRLGAEAPYVILCEELRATGVADEDARTAASVLLHFILGFTTNEQQHHQAAAVGSIASEQDREELDGQFSTDRFVRGIGMILAGITTIRPRL